MSGQNDQMDTNWIPFVFFSTLLRVSKHLALLQTETVREFIGPGFEKWRQKNHTVNNYKSYVRLQNEIITIKTAKKISF